MTHSLIDTEPHETYINRKEKTRLSPEEEQAKHLSLLSRSTTVYVGNLTFFTTEEQILVHFRPCGAVRDVVMGLNERTRQPCGFCFVVYEERESALKAVQNLNRSLLDDRLIKVGWDVGCDHTRRWGRGKDGFQVVDVVRQNLDEGRGGLGALRQSEICTQAVVDDDQKQTYAWVAVPVNHKRKQPAGSGSSGNDSFKKRRF